MDLDSYELTDLISFAILSEIHSKDIYLTQSQKVPNQSLRKKLILLSEEEEAHREILERLFQRLFPGTPLTLPEVNPIPQLSIDGDVEDMDIYEVLELSMEAELAASDYYRSMKQFLQGDSSIAVTLEFLATMEMGHFKLLEHELNTRLIASEFNSMYPNL
jgi:rubrerythrin